MNIPPAIKDYVAQEISKVTTNPDKIILAAAQAAEASIGAGLASILNARIAELRQEVADAVSAAHSQSPDINPAQIAQQAANAVEASIGAGLASIIDQRLATVRQEVNAILAQVQAETAKTDVSAANLLAAVADLDAKLQRYISEDRYALTRAQVSKVMREQKKNG
jgi:hypothetical protein